MWFTTVCIIAALIGGLATTMAGAAGYTMANRVLGQRDFIHNGVNILTNRGLSGPMAVVIDRSMVPNRIYVADSGNKRVLGWHSVAALTNGAPADLVIGQPDFLTRSAECNNAAVTRETFCYPVAIAVDGAGNLYVADDFNNRVLRYKKPFTTSTMPDLVFGQNGSFTSSSCNLGGSITDATLCSPSGVAVDAAGRIYIADAGNSRVLEYNAPSPANTHADTVFGQGGKFNSGMCNNGGISADSLCGPTQIALDSPGNLYVVDAGNSRVLEYNTPLTIYTSADLVFGEGNSFTSKSDNCSTAPSADGFCLPDGVAVDGRGNVFVADYENCRVLEYNTPVKTGDTAPDVVFGQPDFTSRGCNIGQNGLSAPAGLAFDGANNFYVVDSANTGNNRVLRFNDPLRAKPPNVTADLVLGQISFNYNGPNIVKSSGLSGPRAVAVDQSVTPNRLYVADEQNNRVLGWHSVPMFANGAPADIVIGQPNYFSSSCNQFTGGNTGPPAANTLCDPTSVAVDPAGNLYVGDSRNSRVLEYDQPFSSGKIFDLKANLVFGQHGSFAMGVKNNGGISADSLSFPEGVGTDPAGNLYIADTGNNRVLEYSLPIVLGNMSADAVFGQANSFTTNICDFDEMCTRTQCSPGPAGLCGPQAVAVNSAGNVFIADTGNLRVTGYNNPLATKKSADVILSGVYVLTLAFDSTGNLFAGTGALIEFNAPLFTGVAPKVLIPQESGSCYASASSICNAWGVALDSGDNLYVADYGANRVLEFNKPVLTAAPTPTRSPTRTSTRTSTPKRTPSRTPTRKRTPTHTPTRTHPAPTRTPQLIRRNI